MEDRRIDSLTDSAPRGARRATDQAQEATARAGAYVQGQVSRMSEQAQDLAEDAGRRLERLTGRSVEDWTREAQRYVQSHPLQAVAITVGLGFVLGKLFRRG